MEDGDQENIDPTSRTPQFVENNRGNPQLIDTENFVYHVSKRKGNSSYWECSRRKDLRCLGKAVVKNKDGCEEVTFYGSHNHLSSLSKVEAKRLDRETIKAGIASVNVAPTRVVADSLAGPHPSESVLYSRRRSANIVRAIQKQRREENGALKTPSSMAEIAGQPLPEIFTTTSSGDRFLAYKDYLSEDDTDKCFLVFMSPLGKEMLRSSQHWVCDGTFSTTPKPFHECGQIHILYAELNFGQLLPCSFSLLPNKSSAAYERMWGAIFGELDAQDASYRPASIGMDLEMAPANTFKDFSPNSKIIGCFFHWRKCLNDQISKKGCKKFYNQSLPFQDLVTKCVAMALVPISKIHAYFSLVEEELDELEDELQDEAIDWFTYFSRTFIGRRQRVEHKVNKSGGIRKQPLFAHEIWNKYEEFKEGKTTTNNQAEAFNGAWQTRSDKNPSFWSTLRAFRREEALAGQRWREGIVNVRVNHETSPTEGTSRKILQRDRLSRIQNVLAQEGLVPKVEYLSMVSSLLNDL